MRTSNELKSWMENFSSVKKILRTERGEVIIWKDRVIKDRSGNPVPLPEFLKLNGERGMVVKIPIEPKTSSEKEKLAACKSDYKKAMYGLFGSNWRILSRKHRIYNVPSDELLVKEIKTLLK